MIADTGRGGGQAPPDPAERFAVMLDRLTGGHLSDTPLDKFCC
jgi:hypothetical protein